MRKFYEAWKMLDKTTIAIVESLNTGKHIDIQHAMVIPNTFAKSYCKTSNTYDKETRDKDI